MYARTQQSTVTLDVDFALRLIRARDTTSSYVSLDCWSVIFFYRFLRARNGLTVCKFTGGTLSLVQLARAVQRCCGTSCPYASSSRVCLRIFESSTFETYVDVEISVQNSMTNTSLSISPPDDYEHLVIIDAILRASFLLVDARKVFRACILTAAVSSVTLILTLTLIPIRR